MEDLYYGEDTSMEDFLWGDRGSPTHEAEERERELFEKICEEEETERLYQNYLKGKALEYLKILDGCNNLESMILHLKDLGFKGVKVKRGIISFDKVKKGSPFEKNVYNFYKNVLRGLNELTKNPYSEKYEYILKRIS